MLGQQKGDVGLFERIHELDYFSAGESEDVRRPYSPEDSCHRLYNSAHFGFSPVLIPKCFSYVQPHDILVLPQNQVETATSAQEPEHHQVHETRCISTGCTDQESNDRWRKRADKLS